MTGMRELSAMSDSGQALHQRKLHAEYTYRLPTPPRIVVPPPTLAHDINGLVMGAGRDGDVDLSFMNDMGLEDIVQKNTLIEWSYERRRQAQMILPWLYLGPMLAAKDRAFLQREGITMAFAIRSQDNSMMGALNATREVCAEVATIEVPTVHELTARFAETTRTINSHIARFRQHSLNTTGQPTLGRVLVFCESGNEKSAAVVAAYLMNMLNEFDFVKAMQVCQAQRFCVNFDDALKNILRSYWDVLQARRLVAASTAAPGIGNGANNSLMTKPKRTIDNTRDDEDVDMDDDTGPSDDALRFAGRDATPFQNR